MITAIARPATDESLWRQFLFRLGALIVLAVPAGFLVADVTRSHLPGAPSTSRRAVLLADKGGAVDRASARVLALEALRHNPLDVDGVRTLALVAQRDGDADRHSQLLHAAEALSRRDLETQLMLLQDAAASGRARDALRHYDRALTISVRADDLLLPRLVAALSDASIRDDVLAMARVRRPWLERLITLAATSNVPPTDVLALARAAGLDRRRQDDARMLTLLVGEMVRNGSIDVARSLAVGPGASQQLVQDGGFDAANRTILPFGWRVHNRGGWLSAPETVANVPRLVLLARDAMAELVADQLIDLQPGRYRLSFQGGGNAADLDAQPRVSIACAQDPGQDLAAAAIPASSTPETVTADFAVAAGCTPQFLRITGGNTAGIATSAWLTDVSIKPSGA